MQAQIVQCADCGAKNRIPPEKSRRQARCGQCGQSLASAADADVLTLRCSQCRAKNRVPAHRLGAGPKCGKCAAALQVTDVLNGRPVMVGDTTFDTVVLQSPLPVLVYAWASWCSVCATTGPMVEQFAAQAKAKVRVAKLNVEASPQLASTYNILSVPAFFIFDAGQLKEHIPGAVSGHDLMMKMARYL